MTLKQKHEAKELILNVFPMDFWHRLSFELTFLFPGVYYQKTLFLYKEKKMIGCILYSCSPISISTVLAITPIEQQKGYGTMLLNKLENALNKAGHHYIIMPLATESLTFYKKQGYFIIKFGILGNLGMKNLK